MADIYATFGQQVLDVAHPISITSRRSRRRFLELAVRMREADLARPFVERIRTGGLVYDEPIDGKWVAEWSAWSEDRIAAPDPLAGGLKAVFSEVAATREWSFRD